MSYFVEDLLDSIKVRSFAPISQSTFDDSKLISISNSELDLNIVHDIATTREDFFITSERTPIIQNTDHYSVPSRAIGNTLKAVFFLDVNLDPKDLVLIDPARIVEYELTATEPRAYYFEGDEIVLVPKPTISQGQILFQFPAKPNQLIATSSCAKITGITNNNPTATFQVNTDLTTTLLVNDYIDIVSAASPFKLWAYRAQITQITSTIIEVSLASVIDQAGVSIEPQVGDYICPTGFSNIPQIPTAFFPVLAQSVAVRLLESLGDLNKLSKAEQTLLKLETKANRLIRNRVEASPKRVSTRRSLVRSFR